ncbi:MAG: Crp/Fnr family transcriptional regulator [Rhizobiales bacterium]|nr:Crp/Fnr family transcriptional regulator [Hyphomicrobiales bacterium]
MAGKSSRAAHVRATPCSRCPLRPLPIFRNFEPEELDFVSTFKRGELVVNRGSTVLVEGSPSPYLYTLLAGWAFRYKLMPDGRRQILNYVLPGDLIGLQSSLLGEMEHSVEALSSLVLCVFERGQLKELYSRFPGLAFDVTWLAAREEQMLDENLLSIGRRSAVERAAYLLAFLAIRAKALGLAGPGPVQLPVTQQHVADTLGLSLVHTNRTLRKLAERKRIAWKDSACLVLDVEALQAIAHWSGPSEKPRPLI